MSLSSCFASTTQPIEVGKVAWGRDFEVALASSKETGKPVFALFQEVPGCAGCQQFGREVLSNPRLVEAIESEFTPLLIHNNKSGKDAEILQRFGEPAWNYQVVRFFDAAAQDLIPRKDQVWDTGGIASRMIAALKKANRPVPQYLSLLASEHYAGLKQAVFSMYCFWTGEVELGKIDGVIATEAGFMGGHEVTLVRYDPLIVSLAELMAVAEKKNCQHEVGDTGYRVAPTSDQKKQLEGMGLGALNLSPAQATKLNSWTRLDLEKAISYLAPSQRAKLK